MARRKRRNALAALLDWIVGGPVVRAAPTATRGRSASARRQAERRQEASERKHARTAARAARRAVKSHERQSLLGQKMRLRALRKQEREAEQRKRREAAMERDARRQFARKTRGKGGISPFLVPRKRSYEDIFGSNPRRHRGRR